jgi:hypothetical protein
MGGLRTVNLNSLLPHMSLGWGWNPRTSVRGGRQPPLFLAPSAVRAGFTEGTIGHMRTQTIERTDTDERVDDGTDSDTPKYFHYVKKDKIAESAVMGTHVVALCGEVFPVTKAAKPGSPVCPDCKRIYDQLKK